MCGRGGVNRKRAYMDLNLFKQIIENARKEGIKVIQLSFYGEPLLYPELIEAVRYIKQEIPDATVVINTNASLLEKQLAKELLDAGMSLFSISIDGNNKSEYQQIRVGLKWDVIRKNVMDLHELINTNNYPAKVNIRGLNLKDFPLDEIRYKDTWSPYADRVFVRNDHYLYSLEKESLVHQLIPCNKIFNQMIIMVNGNVTICAFDWEGKMNYGRFPEKSIRQLWRTPSLLQKRRRHLWGMKKSIDFCAKCSYRAF